MPCLGSSFHYGDTSVFDAYTGTAVHDFLNGLMQFFSLCWVFTLEPLRALFHVPKPCPIQIPRICIFSQLCRQGTMEGSSGIPKPLLLSYIYHSYLRYNTVLTPPAQLPSALCLIKNSIHKSFSAHCRRDQNVSLITASPKLHLENPASYTCSVAATRSGCHGVGMAEPAGFICIRESNPFEEGLRQSDLVIMIFFLHPAKALYPYHSPCDYSSSERQCPQALHFAATKTAAQFSSLSTHPHELTGISQAGYVYDEGSRTHLHMFVLAGSTPLSCQAVIQSHMSDLPLLLVQFWDIVHCLPCACSVMTIDRTSSAP
ncbi:uncharacterized protein LACBIDRAFT_334917 [Laccaria bicolor S238N-H82]|uniref:Predicted protein n=1 Tax=Laccaria bicolor (strain S238N-H82 / ATCC MYA-4686) TaxID=486041 RepID=B0E0S0_LACBS|nr:uncharacterized protein LACBIDRAFT_334917 [Laccaria bicolor S238N-H82]EDQ99554.1 predicted protein [Laccaria bicolor S238N-H82]|eukprot:XP_001889778.1 predicted protein [Laccaria bicolor S238N-H82]